MTTVDEPLFLMLDRELVARHPESTQQAWPVMGRHAEVDSFGIV